MKKKFKKCPVGGENLNMYITEREEDGMFPYITFKRTEFKTYTIFCKELIKGIDVEDVVEFSFRPFIEGRPLELCISDYFFEGTTFKCYVDEFHAFYISDNKDILTFFSQNMNMPEEEIEKYIFEQSSHYIMPNGSTVAHLRREKKKSLDFDRELKHICYAAEKEMQERMKNKRKKTGGIRKCESNIK